MTELPPSEGGRTTPGVRVYAASKERVQVLAFSSLVHLTVMVLGIRKVLTDPAVPYPVFGAVVYGGMLAAVGGLLVVLTVAARRARVTAAGSSLRIEGLTKDRVILLREVTRADWHAQPGLGRVALRSPTGLVSIEFGNYADGRELRAWVRATLPPDVQHGFEKLTDQPSRTRRPPPEVGGRALLLAVVANTAVAAALWYGWDHLPGRVAAGMWVVFTCPGLAVVAAMDAVRRPSRWTVAAAVIAAGPAAVIAKKTWDLYWSSGA